MGLAWRRRACSSRSAVAGLIWQQLRRASSLNERWPWRSSEATRSGKKGTRRLAHTSLAAVHANSSAAWTSGP